MRDMAGDIKTALRAAQGSIPVYYAYPQKFTSLPVVSFYELSNSVGSAADDDELMSNISFSVDIWAKTPEETHRIGASVNSAMATLGFVRDGSYDLYEDAGAAGIYHRNMNFSGKFLAEQA
ncbi:MAG: hypothetical protein PHX51_08060 [Clostridia bacterium]|nr:hypothetical protein [Clostridia bacterium]